MFWILGTIVVFFSPYIYLVVLGRIFKGITMGIVSSLVPVYVSEAIPTKKKGHSLSLTQLFSTLGTLSVYYVGFFFQSSVQDEYSFKYTWAVEAIPAMVLVTLSFFLPESPKWLASKNRWVEAAKNLDRVQRSNTYKKIQRAKKDDKEYVICAYTASTEFKSCSYSDLFKKKYWRYTLVGVATQSFVQMTCASALMYFFDYICAMCGLEYEHRIILVSMQYVTLALFTIFPIVLLDGCRRKDALTFGMFTLGVGFSSLGIVMSVFAVFIPDDYRVQNSPMNWEMHNWPASAVIAIFLFIIAIFASSVVSVSWLYVGELFPGSSRSKGSSICMCASWIVNACLTLALPYAFQYLKYWTFFIVSMFCFTGGAIVSTFPETRDLTELQIELLYEPALRLTNLKSNSHHLHGSKPAEEPKIKWSNNEENQEIGRKFTSQPKPRQQPSRVLPNHNVEKLVDEEAKEEGQSSERKSEYPDTDEDGGSNVSRDLSNEEQDIDSHELSNDSEPEPFSQALSQSNGPMPKYRRWDEQSSTHSVEIKRKSKGKAAKPFTAGSAIDDVIDVYTARETPSDANSFFDFKAEESGDEDGAEEESYYSDDWFENVTKGAENGFEANTSEHASILDSNSQVAESDNGDSKQLGAANFLQFDPLRVSSKRFYHQQRKHNVRHGAA